MLKRLVGHPVRGVPLGGPLVQQRLHLRPQPMDLGEDMGPQQRAEPEPASFATRTHHQRPHELQLAEQHAGLGQPAEMLGQRRRRLRADRQTVQQGASLGREPVEDLTDQVVRDRLGGADQVAEHGVGVAVPHRHRREPDTGGPPSGLSRQRRRLGRGQHHSAPACHLGRRLAGEGEVARPHLDEAFLQPKTSQPEVGIVAARQHQSHVGTAVVQQVGDQLQGHWGGEVVDVVEDKGERQGVEVQGIHHGEQFGHPDERSDPPVACLRAVGGGNAVLHRRTQRGPQHPAVVVAGIDRQPRGGLVAVRHPLGEQLGLAGAGRCAHQHDGVRGGLVKDVEEPLTRGLGCRYTRRGHLRGER